MCKFPLLDVKPASCNFASLQAMLRSGQIIQTNWFLSRPWIRCFSFFVSRPLKILLNLQGRMGHAWSRGLTGISALLPNLPHVRGIYAQLVDSGHCSPNFWPQGPALNRLKCNFVPRPTDCNRDRCQGRLAPVVWRRSSRSVRPVE